MEASPVCLKAIDSRAINHIENLLTKRRGEARKKKTETERTCGKELMVF